MLDTIKALLRDKADTPLIFKRNLVKEYLQVLTLSFLYSRKEYQNLIFYGGSALRHCYGLPRLSEEMDFVDVKGEVNLVRLSNDLRRFFTTRHKIDINTKVQKIRCILKFPILHLLNLASGRESNYLFTKIEIYKEFGFCKYYKEEIRPIFRYGEAVLVKIFDLPTLMATKIRAIMLRKWEKTTKNGTRLAKVKGRDYYDLMWYLEQKVKPNMACIEDFKSEKELYDYLLTIIARLDSQSIKYDLESLIEDRELVKNIGDKIKDALTVLVLERLK